MPILSLGGFCLFSANPAVAFSMKKLLMLAGFAVPGFCIASIGFAWLFTHPPKRSLKPPPADFPYPIENISFATADSLTLRGWYLAAVDSAPGMIILHGYSDNRGSMLQRALLFRAHGYNVLIYDARGCGKSDGGYTTVGLHESRDLHAAVEWLRGRGSSDIALLGVSQGGATVLMAADRLEAIRCIVVESTYPTLRNALDRRFRLYTLLPANVGACLMLPAAEAMLGIDIDDIQPVGKIGRLGCPVLVISGSEDRKTTAEDTRRLFDAAAQPKELWMIDGAGHEGLFEYAGDEYRERVVGFVNRCSIRQRKKTTANAAGGN